MEEVDDDDDDVDYEILDASRMYGTNTNTIPLSSAVQAARHFYGGRFANQALAIENGEAPLVQNLDPLDKQGRSFDEIFGEHLGAVRAKKAGRVVDVTPDAVRVLYDDGERGEMDMYNNQSYNQKSVSGTTDILIMRAAGGLWRGPIADYEWATGDKVAAYDPESLASAWQPVREKISHANDKPMRVVRFSSGRSVIVTADHSLLFFDGARIAPIYPDDCAIGITRSPVCLPLIPDATVQADDEALGYLIGLYLSEGDLPRIARTQRKSGNIRIAVTGARRRQQVDNLICQLGHFPHKRSEGRASFCSAELADWIEDHCGRGAGNKFIHSALLSRSRVFRVALLLGFMAGDGCMESDSNGAIHAHSAITSARLRDDLVLLLGGLGVFSTLFLAGRKRYNERRNDVHGFRVISGHLAKLQRWFFYDDQHEDYLKWARSDHAYRSSSFERISVPAVKATNEYLRPLFLDRLLREQSKTSLVQKRRLGDLVVSKCAAKDAPDGPYRLLGRSDILWDIIESIDESPSEPLVYDLSVANAEAFAVCGGVMVHNSGISSRPLLKKGDVFAPGQMVSASSFTDDQGVANMGLNARIGLVPWKGFSMDDAVPISESFAKRFAAVQYKVLRQENSDGLKTGLSHYRSAFPTRFTKEKLEQFTEDGLIRPGTIVDPGDPLMLATMPRTLSSGGANIGKLSKALLQARRDSATVWEGHHQAEVTAARQTKNGLKVELRYVKPTEVGDKITIRQGAKATVSVIIPDAKMPRTEDGQPLDMMLNPLSLVSRANPASQHEIRLGKVAKKLGTAIKVPSYLPKGQDWNSFISKLEQDNGVSSQERLWDPEKNAFLANPITVGYAFLNKLHHTSAGKLSTRGVGSYDSNEQPARGAGEQAQAKRFSGLENFATLSSGAYALMRENSTLRGQKNNEYWTNLRANKPLPKIGAPFVWDKFRALLSGAGINTREVGKGRFRLSPFTDKDLDGHAPIDIENGDMINVADMKTIKGGLFDDRIVTQNRWGRIKLPRPVINPAMEDSVRVMLGMTKKELEAVMHGEAELPTSLLERLGLASPR